MTLRARLMALALLAWGSCFAVLASLGTWTPFAFVGVLLVALTLRSSAVPLVQFQPTVRWLLIGVGAGLFMVLLQANGYCRPVAIWQAAHVPRSPA